MTLFFLLLASVLSGGGAAVILVEKRFEWPVRNINIPLRRWLGTTFHRKMSRMPTCAVCAAFWVTLFSDTYLCAMSDGKYFMWPFSGFAAAGLLHLYYTLLSSAEKLAAPASAGGQIEAAAEDEEGEADRAFAANRREFERGRVEGDLTTLRRLAKLPFGSPIDADKIESCIMRKLYGEPTK